MHSLCLGVETGKGSLHRIETGDSQEMPGHHGSGDGINPSPQQEELLANWLAHKLKSNAKVGETCLVRAAHEHSISPNWGRGSRALRGATELPKLSAVASPRRQPFRTH